jgi:hypothetical protein
MGLDKTPVNKVRMKTAVQYICDIIDQEEEKFGSVPRYYVECTEDRAVMPFIQRKMYTEMPCEKVYSMAPSHSPFFSKPKELSDIFCEIAAFN